MGARRSLHAPRPDSQAPLPTMYDTIAQGQRARLIAMLGRRRTQRTTQHNTKIRNTYSYEVPGVQYACAQSQECTSSGTCSRMADFHKLGKVRMCVCSPRFTVLSNRRHPAPPVSV